MKNRDIILIFAVVVIVLFMLRKPINKALTRGYQNNNPGNIVKTYDKYGKQTFWQGEVVGKDKVFKTFSSMAWGYRAMFITLRSYLNKQFDTIEEIITRYAPPTENNTEAYIESVTKYTGISRTEVIDTIKEEKSLIAGLSYHENGIKPDVNDINAGYNLLS